MSYFKLFCLLLINALTIITLIHSYGDDPYGGEGYGSDPYGGGNPYGGGDPQAGSLKTLDSVEDINEFLKASNDQATVIGYIGSTYEEDKSSFEEVQSSWSYYYRFGLVTKADVLEELKYDGPVVYVHKPSKYLQEQDEKSKARYTSKKIASASLKKFILDKSIPLVGERSYKTEYEYDQSKKPVITVFFEIDHEKNPKGVTYVTNRLKKLAKEYNGKVIFCIASLSAYSYKLENYGLKSDSKKDIKVGLKNDVLHYKMDGKFSIENIKTFIENFKAGKLVGKEKEEPKPPKNEDDEDDENSYVTKLTNDNANEVLKSGKDIMVEFYAPWCGHCKALKPEYNKLAATFKDDDSVTIAAMDATANSVPKEFDVKGYPTLYFISSKSKKAIPYNGDREADQMAQFIKDNKGK